MKKKILLASTLISLFSTTVSAQESTPENEFSTNISLTSDYRYRGISQTRSEPALQGGADLSQLDGWYAGTWLSTIKWINDTPGAGSTPVEWDLYAGKKGKVSNDIAYDIGVLGYVYAGNKLDQIGLNNANTLEAYAQIGYGPAYIKYSHALTSLFGIIDSKNSGYLDIGANIDITDGTTLNLHAGYQKVTGINTSAASYADYKIGISKELKQSGGIVVSLAAIGTNADKNFYASPANNTFMGKTSLILAITKTF